MARCYPVVDTHGALSMRLSLSILLAFISSMSTAAQTLQFESYSSPDAVCNDGSRSGLYFAPATDEGSKDVWVVQQQGGGWCWDGPSCKARSGSLISSKTWPVTMTPQPGSILDAADTDFSGANKIYQQYCTSDGYVGNATASDATGGLHFRGRAVVEALLQTLVSKGMGHSGNATLIYSGCSAGGRGVMHNSNRVGELVNRHGVTNFVSLIDSGLYIDLLPMAGSKSIALRDQAKGIVSYNQGAVDPACANRYPTEHWKCLIGEYALGTLKNAMLLHAFQDDSYQLGVDLTKGWFGLPLSAATVRRSTTLSAYADGFRNRTRTALFKATDPARMLTSRVGVHSAACYHHCNTEGSAFSDRFTVDGVSLKQVVQSFVFGTEGPTVKIDNCTGEFACGAGCSSWLGHVAR